MSWVFLLMFYTWDNWDSKSGTIVYLDYLGLHNSLLISYLFDHKPVT